MDKVFGGGGRLGGWGRRFEFKPTDPTDRPTDPGILRMIINITMPVPVRILRMIININNQPG
jgi:hypothetical protein